MATDEDREENIPTTGAVFTFGRSRFAENQPNRFWIRDDPVKYAACGDEHTALITASGRLFTFGTNDYGQLGHGHNKPLNKPACVKGLKGQQVSTVACGRSHTLILLTSGDVLACGQNNEGQLGVGDDHIRQTPEDVLKLDKVKVVALAGGAEHSAALTAKGILYLWGSNSDGQLGIDEINQTNAPVSLNFNGAIKQVACGYYHTTFVTERGELYTFGEGDYGKLGYTTNRNVFVPKQVNGLRGKVKKVDCGGRHSVALTENGLIYTFGDGSQGQLGLGPQTLEAYQPEIVEKLTKMKIQDLVCGENHTAVLTESKQMYIWGDGQHGKLGIGNSVGNMFLPQHVRKFTKFDVWRVACGGCHTIVLAKPSNSWENREQERRKNYSKAVSFHGRSAKSDDDEEDSDKNSDNERRKSDFNSIAARDRRRLKGLPDHSTPVGYARNLPPLGQRNGFLQTYPDKGTRPDPFVRPQRTKSDGSGSDSSPTTPHKATTLYSSAQGRQKPDLASRFSTKPKLASSDSDSSPNRKNANSLRNKPQSLYKTKGKSDSSDDNRSTKSDPPRYQPPYKSPAKERSSFSAQLDYTKGKMAKNNNKSDSDTDTDTKRKQFTVKANAKFHQSDSDTKSSEDEKEKYKRHNSASTTGSVSNKDERFSKVPRKAENGRKESTKPKFLDKFRGNKGGKKGVGPHDDSDNETTTSKDTATKSKTCVLL